MRADRDLQNYTPVWHLSFTWKLQAVSRPFMQYVHEPSLPEGLSPGRDGRALALAVPPAALPGAKNPFMYIFVYYMHIR